MRRNKCNFHYISLCFVSSYVVLSEAMDILNSSIHENYNIMLHIKAQVEKGGVLWSVKYLLAVSYFFRIQL